MTRYINGEGRKDFAILKEIAAIVLNSMPPVLIETNKKIEPITQIYLFAIDGLRFVKNTFFSEYPDSKKVPDPKTFCVKFDPKKHPVITDKLAAECVMKTMNLFEHYCFKEEKFTGILTETEAILKRGYSDLLIQQIANGLLLLREIQGKTSVSVEWLCEKEFYSLDMLVQGRIAYYEKLVTNPAYLSSIQREIIHQEKVVKETADKNNSEPILPPSTK